MSDQPWKDQPTPLTDARMECGPLQRPTLSELSDYARALEQRMREGEALLERSTTAHDLERVCKLQDDIKAHLAAAQAMDAGEFPWVAEDRANSREFAKVVREDGP